MPPFIEASVIHCNDPKLDILKTLERKVQNRLDAGITWNLTDENNPILRVDYENRDDFAKNYTREKKVYETFVNYLYQQDITIPELLSKTEPNAEDNTDLYLILKYKTDYKDPIRINYNFTYKIVEFLGIQASFEEIHDGFLLFYKKKKDFMNASIDLNDIKGSIQWLKDRHIWTPTIAEFFKNLNLFRN